MNENDKGTINWFNAVVEFYLVCMNWGIKPTNNENLPTCNIVYFDF